MKDVLLKFFKENNIEYKNKTFVLAISTGVDSSVLLDTFLKIKNEVNIIVAHCNHHKREQSEVEEEYIKKYCLENELKCFVKELYFESTENFQAVAREKRYQFFDEIMEECQASYLVLAHHADDLLETVIMRLSRGSSLAGYGGISTISETRRGKIIRPFLSISKDIILKYAQDNKIKFYEDESNQGNDYTRNRLRHEIIPLLKNEYPSILEKVCEYSKTIKEASEICNSVRDEFIHKIVKKENNKIEFKRNEFLSLSTYLQEEVLFELLKKDKLSKANILELLKIIRSKKANYESLFKNKFILLIAYEQVIINYSINKLEENESKQNVYIVINECKNYYINDNLSVSVSKKTDKKVTNLNELWYNINDLPITIRSRSPGDKIKLRNGYKKIKDILIDLKLSKRERDNILLGCDKDGEVLIIFGVRKSEVLKNVINNQEKNIIIKLEEK